MQQILREIRLYIMLSLLHNATFIAVAAVITDEVIKNVLVY